MKNSYYLLVLTLPLLSFNTFAKNPDKKIERIPASWIWKANGTQVNTKTGAIRDLDTMTMVDEASFQTIEIKESVCWHRPVLNPGFKCEAAQTIAAIAKIISRTQETLAKGTGKYFDDFSGIRCNWQLGTTDDAAGLAHDGDNITKELQCSLNVKVRK